MADEDVVASSKQTKTGKTVDGVTNREVSFTESTDSGTSESDGEWDNLPPFPTEERWQLSFKLVL